MASRRAHCGRARLSSARAAGAAPHVSLGVGSGPLGAGSGAPHPGFAARWHGRVVAVGASHGLWRWQLQYQEWRRHGLGCVSRGLTSAPPPPPPSPALPTAGGLRSLAGPSPPLARWPRPPSGCRLPHRARGLADVGGLGPVALVDYSASTDADSPGISAIPALQLAWRRLRLRLPRRCLPSSPWGRAGGSTTGASHILHATSAPVVSLHSEPPIGKYRHPPRIED